MCLKKSGFEQPDGRQVCTFSNAFEEKTHWGAKAAFFNGYTYPLPILLSVCESSAHLHTLFVSVIPPALMVQERNDWADVKLGMRLKLRKFRACNSVHLCVASPRSKPRDGGANNQSHEKCDESSKQNETTLRNSHTIYHFRKKSIERISRRYPPLHFHTGQRVCQSRKDTMSM